MSPRTHFPTVNQLIGTIYSAYDNTRKESVALKVEKVDKPKRILQFEYQVLNLLQGIIFYYTKGLPNICPVHEFIENKPSNFIVMKLLGKKYKELLGKNLSMVKKQNNKKFTPTFALKLLVN